MADFIARSFNSGQGRGLAGDQRIVRRLQRFEAVLESGLSGIDTTFKKIESVLLKNNQWAVTDPNLPSWQRGGSNANEQLQLLTSYGLRADLLAGYNETGIANLVRSGRGVIVAVDVGVIWEATQFESGQVNHAVTLTGAVYAEADGALLGFYVTDSGRAKVSDMTRFIPINLFREAANVPGAYSLYTIEPVKLWDENIDGMGNESDNRITGNRGDNELLGLAGADTLVGLKSRRWDGDSCSNENWRMVA